MKTAIKICEYDDILAPRDIYSLLAITALQNRFYGICSTAFVKVVKSSVAVSAILITLYTIAVGDSEWS